MLKRAAEEPLAAIVCMFIQFVEVTLGIVDSEGGRGRKEDFKLYRSCHKIQLLLWVVTNSYRYTRSTFDQMCEWETASDWEMAMNKELLFTKETRHGTPIFADKSVEHQVNQVRKFEGKLDRYGMDNRLHATVK